MCPTSEHKRRVEYIEQYQEALSPLNLWGAGKYYGREIRPDSMENIRLLFEYYALVCGAAQRYRERKAAESAAQAKPENAS